MHKCRGVINVEITSEAVRGKSSEVEEIKITQCSIKIRIDIINEEIKGSISEEEEI